MRLCGMRPKYEAMWYIYISVVWQDSTLIKAC